MSVWVFAARTAITYTVAAASATRPGHSAAWLFSVSPAIGSHPLTDLLPDQPGWAPGHDGDNDGKGEHVLIGAGEGQQHGAYGLQSGEQKAAEYSPIDAAEPADDRGGKADHAEVEPHAEVDLVVIQTVHHPCERGKARADREGDKDD